MSDSHKSEYPPAYTSESITIDPPSEAVPRINNQAYYGYQEESLGKVPRQFYCPNCNRFNWSKVDSKPGLFSWLACTYLCLIGCWLCCFFPFCINKCKDTIHFCVTCGEKFAIVTPI